MKSVFKLTLALGFALLSACGPKNSAPSPSSQVDTKNAVASYASGVNALTTEIQSVVSIASKTQAGTLALAKNLAALQSAFLGPQAMLQLPSQIKPQADAVFPLQRGVYACENGNCQQTDTSDDLIYISKTKDGKTVKSITDWDSSSTGAPVSTVVIPDPQFSYEVPQKQTSILLLDDKTLMQLTAETPAGKSRCTPGQVTTKSPYLKYSGFINRVDGSKLIEGSISVNLGETGYSSSGQVSAYPKGDTFSVKWNADAKGSIKYSDDNTHCDEYGKFILGNLKGTLEASGSKQNFKLDVQGSDLIYNQFNQFDSIKLDGSLVANGKFVQFAGILDDANKNGVLGDDLTLTFADGTTTLQDFLINSFGVKPHPAM